MFQRDIRSHYGDNHKHPLVFVAKVNSLGDAFLEVKNGKQKTLVQWEDVVKQVEKAINDALEQTAS